MLRFYRNRVCVRTLVHDVFLWNETKITQSPYQDNCIIVSNLVPPASAYTHDML